MDLAGVPIRPAGFALFLCECGWSGSDAVLNQVVQWLADQHISDSTALIELQLEDFVGILPIFYFFFSHIVNMRMGAMYVHVLRKTKFQNSGPTNQHRITTVILLKFNPRTTHFSPRTTSMWFEFTRA